jgi:hypothetical protein
MARADSTVCNRPARRCAVDAYGVCPGELAAISQVAGDAPVTILAVPRYHDERRAANSRPGLATASRGDELALHGCTHRDHRAGRKARSDTLRRSHFTRGEGEFWSLSRKQALERIDVGIEWFARIAGRSRASSHRLAARTGSACRLAGTPVRLHGDAAPADPPATQIAGTEPSIVYSTSEARGGAACRSPGMELFDVLERRNPRAQDRAAPARCRLRAGAQSWQKILARALHGRKPATCSRSSCAPRALHEAAATVW